MIKGNLMQTTYMLKMAILAVPAKLFAKRAGNCSVKRGVIVSGLLALSACAAPLAMNKLSVSITTVNFVPELALTALAEGRLDIRNGCIRLIGREGGNGDMVIWPKGSRLIMRDGQKRIIERSNGTQFVIGQRVSLGGGASEDVSNDILTEPLPTECHGPYFFAN